MTNTAIYQDIATRTGGDIYIGVVGPARTGKSTFIKRFMETIVLPNIENTFQRERAKDELPQSGSGRTIITVEPKFVSEEAIDINVAANIINIPTAGKLYVQFISAIIIGTYIVINLGIGRFGIVNNTQRDGR